MSDADNALRDERYGLWLLVSSPVLWAGHFMLCYVVAAMLCGRFGGAGSLPLVRTTIGLLTAAALGGIGVVGFVGYRRHARAATDLPHDDDTPEDRQGFLGFATLLLSGLSAVAVIYAALVVVFIDTCQ